MKSEWIDEEIRKEIEKELNNEDFWKGFSLAITLVKEKLNELENEILMRRRKGE